LTTAAQRLILTMLSDNSPSMRSDVAVATVRSLNACYLCLACSVI
jgi:hypothetical protein